MADNQYADEAKQRHERVPKGYHAVTPWIIANGASTLIDFMEKVFGAQETPGTRFYNTDGTIGHVEVRIGDSVLMLFDSRPEWPATPAFLRLYVADADDICHRALQAGATTVSKVAEYFFGDRIGRICDPAGNIWWIQSHIEDIAPEEMTRRMKETKYVENMKEAQASLDRELRRRK